MRTTAVRTGSLAVLASLAILGSGLLRASVAADQEEAGNCGCPPLSLRSSTDIDEVVAVRKMEMAAYLVARH
ncbi:hypothetical protein [Nocardioides guangzhouensis]|uniref:hypothetical protein n=1 Tax=Nocardioides guangzhouensis TaxID=2497878 RepID=UPI00143853FD|nr:hypothetical protein [Nocardioides guangzhouensis]